MDFARTQNTALLPSAALKRPMAGTEEENRKHYCRTPKTDAAPKQLFEYGTASLINFQLLLDKAAVCTHWCPLLSPGNHFMVPIQECSMRFSMSSFNQCTLKY